MSDFVYKPENAQIGFGTKSLRMIELLAPFLKKANECKYDFIDCAWRYGNEAIIGLALKAIKKSDMSFDLSIAFQSKVWPSQFAGGIAKSLKFTLQKIGAINVIDSYMLHRPSHNLESNLSAWKQLLDCKRNRITKKIGLGHFDKDLMEFLFTSTSARPDFVQIELSVNNMRWDRIFYCWKHNIQIQATEPLGLLEENEKNPIIIEMTKKYNTDVKRLLLAYLLNQGITPIVVSVSIEEIDNLITAKNILLDKEDIEKLKTLNTYSSLQFEGIEVDIKN